MEECPQSFKLRRLPQGPPTHSSAICQQQSILLRETPDEPLPNGLEVMSTLKSDAGALKRILSSSSPLISYEHDINLYEGHQEDDIVLPWKGNVWLQPAHEYWPPEGAAAAAQVDQSELGKILVSTISAR